MKPDLHAHCCVIIIVHQQRRYVAQLFINYDLIVTRENKLRSNLLKYIGLGTGSWKLPASPLSLIK